MPTTSSDKGAATHTRVPINATRSRRRPFRLVEQIPSELALHQACARALDLLLRPPAVWRSLGDGHVQLSHAETGRLSSIGAKPGWPDILIVFAGLTFAVELKRRGGRLSKTRMGRTRRGSPKLIEGQEDVFPKLRAAGMAIAVCTSVEEMVAQLRRWGIPLISHR